MKAPRHASVFLREIGSWGWKMWVWSILGGQRSWKCSKPKPVLTSLWLILFDQTDVSVKYFPLTHISIGFHPESFGDSGPMVRLFMTMESHLPHGEPTVTSRDQGQDTPKYLHLFPPAWPHLLKPYELLMVIWANEDQEFSTWARMRNFIFLPHMTRAFQSAMSKGRSLREVKTVTIQAIKKPK